MRFHAIVPLLLGCALIGCQSAPAPSASTKPGEGSSSAGASAGPLTELKTEDTKVGTGEPAAEGDTVYMRYTGRLTNGTVFDSNDKPDGQPFTFQLGPNANVIQGWNKGIIGMKVGGKRTLHIPAALAYGSQDKGTIPPNSDLNFDVELLGMLKAGEENTVIKKDVKTGSGPEAKKGSKIKVKYRGTLMDGKEFENRTFTFTIGKNEVVAGFDVGVIGMKKGGIRELTIPPMAGFGPAGSPPTVPGNAILHFTIELLSIG